jgi:hypothetical protein
MKILNSGLGQMVCVSLALMAVSANAAPQPTIPKSFQGAWYEGDKACDDDNQYPLDIEATEISSGEDSSTLVSVRILSQSRIEIVTDNYGELTSDSPPGSDAYAGRTHTMLTLSGKGQKLKIVYQNGIVANLKRCPL